MRIKMMPAWAFALVLPSSVVPSIVAAQEVTDAEAPSMSQVAPETSTDAAVATVPVDPAVAPAAPAEPAAEPGGNRLTGEIIVTAQKREENAQDVPITIQAFSEGALDALGVKTTQDLQLVTPSLNYGEFVGYSIVFMRGVGTDAFLTADPSITTYVDGVYLPFSFGQTADFGSIDRVEVLKGPQGTLFGRNAVGGALAVYTADPEFDDFAMNLSAAYGGHYSDGQVKGTVNIPVIDTLAFSFSGNYHRTDVQYKGFYATDPTHPAPRGFEPEVSKGFRVKGLWQPADWLDVTAAFARNSFVGYSTSITPVLHRTLLSSTVAALTNTDPQGYPDYYSESNVAGLGYDSNLVYGRIGLHPGPFDVKVFGSRQYTGNYQFYDFDGSNTPLAEFVSPTHNGSGARGVTGELQVLSNDESPWSEHFQWVGGVYYFESQAGFRKPATLYLNSIDTVNVVFNSLATLAQRTDFALLTSVIALSPTGRLGFTSGVGTDSIAGYAQGTLKLTDWVSLTLGGRYQDEKRDVNESGTWAQRQDLSFYKIIDRRDEDSRTKSFSPKVSLEFHPVDDLMLYTSYQEATKSGTFNAVNIYDTVDYVKPERMKAYEVGAKSELFDGVRLNLAAWLYKQKNLQTQFVSLLKGGAVSFETAGAAKSKGVEFDLNWLVFPGFADDLVVIASGAYVDAKYTSYPNASGFEQTTGILQQNLDFTGNRVPQAAKFTGSVQLNKTFHAPSLSSSFEVGANVYYNDGFFWTAQNVENSREPSYHTVGAQMSWLYEPSGVRLTAYGTNLANDDHNLQMFTTDFGVVRNQVRKAEYGLRFEATF